MCIVLLRNGFSTLSKQSNTLTFAPLFMKLSDVFAVKTHTIPHQESMGEHISQFVTALFIQTNGAQSLSTLISSYIICCFICDGNIFLLIVV